MPHAERNIDMVDLDLEALRGRRRPLLIFAPTIDTDGYVRQKQMLAAQQGGVEARDIVVVEVVGNDRGFIGDKRLSPESAGALRELLGVPIDDLTVLLLGKDGSEKLRERRAIPTHRLFDLIDEMPRRQDEIQRER